MKRAVLSPANSLRVHPSSEVCVANKDEPAGPRLCATRRIRRCASANRLSRRRAHAGGERGLNTGALMAISRFVLKTIPGIDRPAIATVLPNQKGTFTYVLDLAQRRCARRSS